MTRYFMLVVLAFVTSAWSLAHPGGSGGNSVCAQFCAANFPNPGKVCTAPAAHGEGPCYVCGPLKTSPTQQLCGGACCETSTDSKNCGQCGKMCPSGAVCDASSCKCTNSGLPPCNGACPDLQTDSKNCGKCGNTCPSGSTCYAGACKCTNSGKAPCNGACPDLSSDSHNCGTCGNTCPTGSTCYEGACKCTNSGKAPCNGACPDLYSDSHNCGTCGNTCPTGSTCYEGACKCTNSGQTPCNGACCDLYSDNHNCGKCGNTCPTGSTCYAGACKCTNSGKAPCGGACPDLSSDNHNCGECGKSCESGTVCKTGTCTSAMCDISSRDKSLVVATKIFKNSDCAFASGTILATNPNCCATTASFGRFKSISPYKETGDCRPYFYTDEACTQGKSHGYPADDHCYDVSSYKSFQVIC